MTRRPALGAALLALALATLTAGACEPARPDVPPPVVELPRALQRPDTGGVLSAGEALVMRSSVSPAPARLGQRLLYRAFVTGGYNLRSRIDPPAPGGAFTWGAPRRRDRRSVYDGDTTFIGLPLQVFATGVVSIPGPDVHLTSATRRRVGGVTHLPTVTLIVLPSLGAADSAASLRPVHGPLAAPWWERVPWLRVSAVLAAVALLAGLVARLRRRRRVAPAIARAPRVAAPPPLDPAAEALQRLSRLRARRLPEAGQFGEHAQELTFILRAFFEATLQTPRPGDTSGELLGRLRAAALGDEDVHRLAGLLDVWDRVKFARAPLDVAGAEEAELAVEQVVRRRERPREVA